MLHCIISTIRGCINKYLILSYLIGKLNSVYFGPQTAKNRTGVLAHPTGHASGIYCIYLVFMVFILFQPFPIHILSYKCCSSSFVLNNYKDQKASVGQAVAVASYKSRQLFYQMANVRQGFKTTKMAHFLPYFLTLIWPFR